LLCSGARCCMARRGRVLVPAQALSGRGPAGRTAGARCAAGVSQQCRRPCSRMPF
jgi:hypothetical protein